MKVGEFLLNNATAIIIAVMSFIIGIAMTQVSLTTKVADMGERLGKVEVNQRKADDRGKRILMVVESLCSKQVECAARYPAFPLAKED